MDSVIDYREFIRFLDELNNCNCRFSDALVLIMEYYHILVCELARNSGLSDETIKGYRNNENSPNPITVIQLCLAMKIPYCVALILLRKAGVVLGIRNEDFLYAFFLEHSKEFEIYDCNQLIEEYNLGIFYKENLAKKFKEPKVKSTE